MRAVQEARFFFDAGSGGVLWPTGSAARQIWGSPVDLALLPVSDSLRRDLDELAARYDTSLNWDDPPAPGPWREARCTAFNREVRDVVGRLREELGPAWQITDQFDELHEDPDLDRYLADPAGFRR
ncbi:hypothetical protein ACFQY4_14880 [Catellatospora bangladeshensis]|uniref:hypothetical protein n=1 Tax=Catellatospora bangladeshensis TaxID=310355 RepID=UPI0019409C5F|nr:hypothetical protein [Catellatospora bangladeshensis]